MADPATAADPIARLSQELSTLARAYSPGHHGRWSARRRADLFDAALVELYRRAGAPPASALAAVGGYGRRQMLPRSDVDLLILHDDGVDPAALADAVLYPLWDAGFEVGHSVRTVAACADEAAGDLEIQTSLLDLRHVAGSTALAGLAREAVLSQVSADPASFAGGLRRDREAREARWGSTAHLLEPDPKQGSGALRDVHLLGWLSAALGRPLTEAGLARASEIAAVDAAEEFLVRVRSAIQVETGRRDERLVADLQPEIARLMGFTDEPRLIAMDGFMRAFFEHARQVDHVVTLVLDRLEEPDADDGAAPLAGAGSVLSALAEVAEAGSVPSAALLDRIEEVDLDEPVAWNDAVRDGFLRLLRTERSGVSSLETLDRLGLLARLIPEWADVRCRPQRDPFHRFTVDGHLTATVGLAAGFLEGSTAMEEDREEDPIGLEAVPLLDDPDGFLLGTLLHDIGKIGEGRHVPLGADRATVVLERMGFLASTRELATFMVAEHLLLPNTAVRRDLGDEDLILEVADRIGSQDRLAALYLLAKADAGATGPGAWTPWRRTLIGELVAKVQRVFEQGGAGRASAERLTGRIDRVRDLLRSEPKADVDGFVLRMPRGYFSSIEPARAARHFPTISPPIGSREVRTATAEGSQPDTYEVLVVAADRPGLLSWIAGALTLGGISILSAQIFTTDDDVAVDLFEVEGAFDPEIGESRWREFRSMLRRAIGGSISLEQMVERKRANYPPPAVDLPVKVVADDGASDFFTVIEVSAPDRIGRLYDITRTLAELHLDVHVAKVDTSAGRVVDAFYVRDALGRKIQDPTQIAEVEGSIRDRLT